MKDLVVLITGCGSPGAYGTIKSLRANREREIRIVGIDVDPLVANRYFVDQFHIPPNRTNPEFLGYVLDLARRENANVVYPVPTAELEMFALARTQFEAQGQRVVVSSPQSLAIANNKARLFKKVSEARLSCAPRYRVVHSWNEFVAAAQELGYPDQRVCIKPSFGTGSKGFRILDAYISRLDLLVNALPTSTYTSVEELAAVLRPANPFPEFVVMEYLPGDEYDVDVLAWKGESMSIIPRRNERMWYGLSLVSRADPNAAIMEFSRQVVATLDLSYVVSLSFRMNSDGYAKLIEVNPRIPGSIIAATMAGVNMPYLAVKLALGEHVSIPPVRWKTQMTRYWEEMFQFP